MADFTRALAKVLNNEGGFILHEVDGDRGGQTYAGIARNHHPGWDGWEFIDSNDLNNPALTDAVEDFYRANFWNRLRADVISPQKIAETIFDFAVNAGLGTAAKLAQSVVGVSQDGVIGPKTLALLNSIDEEIFVAKYALAKMTRYAEICRRDPRQSKFLLGWLNRTLKEIA